MRENGFSEADIKGQFEYEDFFDRMRRALREGVRDTWVGDSPAEEELRELLGHDPELVAALFEDSVADVIDRHVADPRLQQALYGQGVIGAWAGPRTPGTASIKLMHFQGTLEGVPMAWGYVEGGHGPDLVRHRRGGARGRGAAGRRGPGRRDPPRRGRRARRRRA